MRLINTRSIIKRFEQFIESPNNSKDCYLPLNYKQLLLRYIEELYQSTFQEEEGNPLPFRMFLGDKSYIKPSMMAQNIGYSNEFFDQEYVKLGVKNILSSINIKKIALSCDPKRFLLILEHDEKDVFINGFVYFSGVPLTTKITDEFKSDSLKVELECLGFVFESQSFGHLSIRFGDLLCNIQEGAISWLNNSERITDLIFTPDPFNEEVQKIFHDSEINHSFLYRPLINAIREIDKDKSGGALICTTDEALQNLHLDIKYETNIPIENIEWKDVLKKNYWYKRLSDLIYYFARIDGAVLITNSVIKGYGVKINHTVDEERLPSVLKNTGTRHRSAYALADDSPSSLFVTVISEDGGITFIRKWKKKPQVFFYDGLYFKKSRGKGFDSVSFSKGFG